MEDKKVLGASQMENWERIVLGAALDPSGVDRENRYRCLPNQNETNLSHRGAYHVRGRGRSE